MSGEANAVQAVQTPATITSLTSDLAKPGLLDGRLTIVHSSLSALGWVAGGAQAVVEALLAAVRPTGTLVMPTQSGQLSDPAGWGDPPVPPEWIDDVRSALPAYDPHLTATRSMGAIVECFRTHPDTVRSAHPLTSFAANGPLAHQVIEPNAFTPAFGESSPVGRLYELDAQILLLGVDHQRNTSLHLAEYRAEWEGKTSISVSAPMLVHGKRQWVTEPDLDIDESDFGSIGDAFAATGAELTFPVGNTTARLSQVSEIVDFAAVWMSQHRPGSLAD